MHMAMPNLVSVPRASTRWRRHDEEPHQERGRGLDQGDARPSRRGRREDDRMKLEEGPSWPTSRSMPKDLLPTADPQSKEGAERDSHHSRLGDAFGGVLPEPQQPAAQIRIDGKTWSSSSGTRSRVSRRNCRRGLSRSGWRARRRSNSGSSVHRARPPPTPRLSAARAVATRPPA